MTTPLNRKTILFAALILAASAGRAGAQLPMTVLTSFDGTHGAMPFSGVTLSPDGATLYGTTWNGGTSNFGTVYSLPAAGGTPTVLASFNGPNGKYPFAGLKLVGNTLYGTTQDGGTYTDGNNWGTVYSIPRTGGPLTVLSTFRLDAINGQGPEGALTLSGNKLYGTTFGGGPKNFGTVFSIEPSGNNRTTLATFSGTDGKHTYAGVIASADGSTLYGTMYYGGAGYNSYEYANGVVFSVPAAGGAPTVLASFDGTNGAHPRAVLTLSPDGTTLFGTTEEGGTYNRGTIFSVPVTGDTPTVLASFSGTATSGRNPHGGLILSPDGMTLYGTTRGGGPNGGGTVFSIPVTGGTPTILASFNGNSPAYGAFPVAGLSLSPDGNILYGTTSAGGTYGYGTVFSVTLAPEPASLALLALAAPALLTRRRTNHTFHLTRTVSAS